MSIKFVYYRNGMSFFNSYSNINGGITYAITDSVDIKRAFNYERVDMHIGCSVCKVGENFDKKHGKKLAINRIEKVNVSCIKLRSSKDKNIEMYAMIFLSSLNQQSQYYDLPSSPIAIYNKKKGVVWYSNYVDANKIVNKYDYSQTFIRKMKRLINKVMVMFDGK